MIFTILLLLHFFDLNPHSIRANTLNQPNSKRHEIQGTWKTASPGRLYEPNYTIIIDKRELFIMYNQGSDGYKQLLTYKIEGHNVIAKEKEIIFFSFLNFEQSCLNDLFFIVCHTTAVIFLQ